MESVEVRLLDSYSRQCAGKGARALEAGLDAGDPAAAQWLSFRNLDRVARARDAHTRVHLLRMSGCAALLAEAAGMSADQCETMLMASPLHDIGKIAIPDSILLKPEPLTAMEWEVMKTHTRLGEEILRGHDSVLFRTAASLARTHHERWDGAGYPDGLRGEQIPLESRIVALCDVFDALLSDRPYKLAWSVEDTVAYIEAHSGSHFDPGLVKIFAGMVPDLLAGRNVCVHSSARSFEQAPSESEYRRLLRLSRRGARRRSLASRRLP